MKLLPTLLFLGALFAACTAAADELAVEAGVGNHWSKNSNAGFVRYQRDLALPVLPHLPAYSEISAGAWDHKNDNTAVGIALGLQPRWGNFHFDGSLGVAYLAYKTRYSGTHQQFILRLGAGYRVGNFDFAVFQTHYSNAKPIFGWDGPNVGYDFLTFQIGYVFK